MIKIVKDTKIENISEVLKNISEKTGEGIAVDGRIKVRMKEALTSLHIECDCQCC